ncbi:MAG: hypothetical protein P4K93_07535 [Terracidiphilus sp.]|nr:hypothetical protein [Terracidiphilus sp.]
MTDYQKAKRPDLAILDVLSRKVVPIPLTTLYSDVCPEESWVSIEAIASQVRSLESTGHLHCSLGPDSSVPLYSITCKGRAHLIVADTHTIFHNHLKEEPASVSICNAPEVSEATEEYEPAIAMLCVDEAELDKWWKALDVEAKADAFMQWSLSNDGRNSHIYIDPSIPVVGTIGNSYAPLSKEATEAIRKDIQVLQKAARQ